MHLLRQFACCENLFALDFAATGHNERFRELLVTQRLWCPGRVSAALAARAEAQGQPTKAQGRSMLGPRVFRVLSDVGAPRQVRHTFSCRAASCRQPSLRRSKRTDARATPG